MSNAAYTRGPWFQSGEDSQIRANTADGHTTICELWSTDADARLIAAAPEMLEALELCEDVLSELARLDDGTPSISALIMARAVMAKVKGV